MLIDFREKGKKGEREEERHRCKRETSIGCLSHVPDWGPNRNLSTCPDPASNQRPFGFLRDAAQPMARDGAVFLKNSCNGSNPDSRLSAVSVSKSCRTR